MTRVKVLIRFKDKFISGKYYEKDSVAEFEDEARITDLVKRGLAEIESDTAGLDISRTAKDVIEAVQAYSNVDALQEMLTFENGKDKPRKSVVEAIEARIAELNP